MTLPTHIIRADWHDYSTALQRIRQEVFIDEQKVPRDVEWDGEDETSHHYLAINEAGQHIGCARLMPSGQIGRMAVVSTERRNGIGFKLLEAALEHAHELGFREVYLHAQLHALAFYQKAGFVAYGDQFVEAGIDHRAMKLNFPLEFEAPDDIEDAAPKVRHQDVRESLTVPITQTVPFDDMQGTRQQLLETICAARRIVRIMSPLLDADLFDRTDVVAALSDLARSSPRAEVRILIFDSKLIVHRGHAIVELARRLDGKVKIRLIDQTYNTKTSTFVSADLDAYWLLPNFEVYEGISDAADPVTTKRLNETFDSLWEKGREDPELRVLRI